MVFEADPELQAQFVKRTAEIDGSDLIVYVCSFVLSSFCLSFCFAILFFFSTRSLVFAHPIPFVGLTWVGAYEALSLLSCCPAARSLGNESMHIYTHTHRTHSSIHLFYHFFSFWIFSSPFYFKKKHNILTSHPLTPRKERLPFYAYHYYTFIPLCHYTHPPHHHTNTSPYHYTNTPLEQSLIPTLTLTFFILSITTLLSSYILILFCHERLYTIWPFIFFFFIIYHIAIAIAYTHAKILTLTLTFLYFCLLL